MSSYLAARASKLSFGTGSSEFSFVRRNSQQSNASSTIIQPVNQGELQLESVRSELLELIQVNLKKIPASRWLSRNELSQKHKSELVRQLRMYKLAWNAYFDELDRLPPQDEVDRIMLKNQILASSLDQFNKVADEIKSLFFNRKKHTERLDTAIADLNVDFLVATELARELLRLTKMRSKRPLTLASFTDSAIDMEPLDVGRISQLETIPQEMSFENRTNTIGEHLSKVTNTEAIKSSPISSTTTSDVDDKILNQGKSFATLLARFCTQSSLFGEESPLHDPVTTTTDEDQVSMNTSIDHTVTVESKAIDLFQTETKSTTANQLTEDFEDGGSGRMEQNDAKKEDATTPNNGDFESPTSKLGALTRRIKSPRFNTASPPPPPPPTLRHRPTPINPRSIPVYLPPDLEQQAQAQAQVQIETQIEAQIQVPIPAPLSPHTTKPRPTRRQCTPAAAIAAAAHLRGCIVIMILFMAFTLLSVVIGTYFSLHGRSMGDAFTVAGYVVAIGTLPCGALCAHHYPRCRCWGGSGSGSGRIWGVVETSSWIG